MKTIIAPMIRTEPGQPDGAKALSIRKLGLNDKGEIRRRQFLSWKTGCWVSVKGGKPLPKEVVMESGRTAPRESKNARRRRAAVALGDAPKEVRVPGTRKKPNLPGRNALCPCGSGKKWKVCCGWEKGPGPVPPPSRDIGVGG